MMQLGPDGVEVYNHKFRPVDIFHYLYPIVNNCQQLTPTTVATITLPKR